MFFCKFFKCDTPDLEAHIFNSTSEINKKDWNAVANPKSVYLSLEYLSALEENLTDHIDFRFLVFYSEKKKPVAIAALQSLRFMDKGLNNKVQVSQTRQKIKKHILNSFEINILTCGTPFACGETGFAYTSDINEKDAFENLSIAVTKLQKEDDKLNSKILLLKEFWPKKGNSEDVLVESDFHKFQADVNMVMQIPSTWNTLDDYLSNLKTKFRTKAKRALKKSDPLEIRSLNENEIEHLKLDIGRLYSSVLEKSDFTFGSLDGNTFVSLKKNLQDNFILKGYFLEDELIGFSSAFIFNNIIDANYVGINYSFNRNYSIYERMLYDYVELAITSNCTEVRFGRTAEEIKSTIGAEPIIMDLYIKHQSHLKNKLLKPIFNSIQASDFELRKPFKETFYQSKSELNTIPLT